MYNSRTNNIVGFLHKKSLLSPSNQNNLPYQRQLNKSRFQKQAFKQTYQQKINAKQPKQFQIKHQKQYFPFQKSYNYLDKTSRSLQKVNQNNHSLQNKDKINIYKNLAKSKVTTNNHTVEKLDTKISQLKKHRQIKLQSQSYSPDKTIFNKIQTKKSSKQSKNLFSPNKSQINTRFFMNNKFKNTLDNKISQSKLETKKQQNLQFENKWKAEQQLFKPIKFQSSKVQARICLSQLQQKLQNSIILVQEFLSEISIQYQKTLLSLFHKLRNELLFVVQQELNHFQQRISRCFNQTKQKTISCLIDQKYELKHLQEKIINMKEEIQSQNNWRNITGELISTNLQEQIQNKIDSLQEKVYLTKLDSKSWFKMKNYKESNQKQKSEQSKKKTNLIKALQAYLYDQ